MSAKIEGINELINKLDGAFSQQEINKMQKDALKPTAEEIKNDMKSLAPVCDESERHGRDVISIKFNKKYEIGLWSQDDFEVWRSLWFSEYGSPTNMYYKGWFSNWINQEGNKYEQEARDNLKKAIIQKLK